MTLFFKEKQKKERQKQKNSLVKNVVLYEAK